MDNNEMPSVEEFRAAFGLVDDEPEVDETPTENNPPSEDDTPDTPDEKPTGDDTNTDPKGQEGNPDQDKARLLESKQNQAFAKMRTENAQYHKALSEVAQVLGIDPKLPTDQLAAQLGVQARAAMARKQGIDPQIAERLDQLEQVNARYQQIQMQQKAQTAFMAIQEKYKATPDDVNAFVDTLISDSVDITNPYFDLETEFVKRNFDKIVSMKIDEAVAAEQARATKAGGASKPDGKQGQDDKREHKEIKSVSDLDEYLTNLSN